MKGGNAPVLSPSLLPAHPPPATILNAFTERDSRCLPRLVGSDPSAAGTEPRGEKSARRTPAPQQADPAARFSKFLALSDRAPGATGRQRGEAGRPAGRPIAGSGGGGAERGGGDRPRPHGTSVPAAGKEIGIETRSDVRGEGRCGTGPHTPQPGSERSFIIIIIITIISAARVVYTVLFSPTSLLPLTIPSTHLSK